MTSGRQNWNDAKGPDADAFRETVVGRYAVRAITSMEDTQAALSDLALNVRAAEDELAMAVGAAKLAGASWAQVGEALDLSKQAAQQRFGRHSAMILEADEQLRNRMFSLLRIVRRHVRYEIRVGTRHGELLSRHRDERVAVRTYVDRLERWDADGRCDKMPRCYKVTPGEGRNVRLALLDLPALRKLGEKRAARIMETCPREDTHANEHTRGWLDAEPADVF